MTLAATAKKLVVNFHHYILDRVSGSNALPSLAEIIRQRASELDLGASWQPDPQVPTPDY